MDSSTLVTMGVSIAVILAAVVVAVVVGLLSIALPVAIAWIMYKRLSSGGAVVVVGGPVVEALVAQASPPPPPAPEPVEAAPPPPRPKAQVPAAKASPVARLMVKRTTCRACGAPKVQRSLSAYVYCDFCGALADWDFQACLADKRSKLPGPTYEAILRRLRPRLDATAKARDRDAYRALQVEIYDTYVGACPAACPPRVGDPRFRKEWVAWTADSQTMQDLDPATAASMAGQEEAVRGLVWDRSDLFAPKVEVQSFWRLLDAVSRHARNCVDQLVREGHLERHPDRPDPELFLRIGASALVQGWLPYLPGSANDELLARTGLRDEFVEVDPRPTKRGPCPNCSAPMEVVEGARRVLCYACGHMAGVGAGTLPCHSCGAPVDIPASGNLFACPHCSAELRMMR